MSNPNHPGASATECPLRIPVSDNRTDGARGGYACYGTGGHCLPSSACAQLRDEVARDPKHSDIFDLT